MNPRTFEERRPIGVSVEELKRTLDAVETLGPAHPRLSSAVAFKLSIAGFRKPPTTARAIGPAVL